MTEPISTTVRRRRHGASLKAQILAECERPGASIAAVAMAHGVNANLVHKWRARASERQDTAVTAPNVSFVPVPLQAAALTSEVTELRIECKRLANSPCDRRGILGMIVSTYLLKWTPHDRTNLDDSTSAPPWRKPEGADSRRMRTTGRIDCRCRHGTWRQCQPGA